MNGRQAAELGDKVRSTVQEHAFLYDGKKIPVTSSVGVAELKPEFDSSQAFLKTADKALYHSKQTGRNRVTLAV
jgi:diguanylate cyclase (GGDEF)-like protein